MQATFEDQATTVCQLLALSANVNKANRQSMTALQFAAHRSNVEILNHLIKQADLKTINNVDKYGRTALITAADRGNYQIC